MKPSNIPVRMEASSSSKKEEPKSFDEEKADLKQRVLKDGRAQISRDVVLANIKAEYGFTQYPEALAEIYPIVTDSIFVGKWDPTPYLEMNKVLFKIGNMKFLQKDLVNYIATKQKKREKENLRIAVDKIYQDYINESLIKWENAHLEKKYPEFKALVSEYRDGILLFDLTDKKVWSKAVKDTVGLKLYYESHKTSYMWDTRADASVYKMKDPAAASKVRNFIKSGLTNDAILKEINTPGPIGRRAAAAQHQTDLICHPGLFRLSRRGCHGRSGGRRR